MNSGPGFEELQDLVRAFERERGWEPFHDEKNLAMALASEVGELCAILRWTPSSAVSELVARPDNHQRIKAELGDIGILFLMLCDRLSVLPSSVITDKLRINGVNYPNSRGRGFPERASDTSE